MIDVLLDNTYKTVDDRAIIYLYLLNSILKDREFKPYFYVELYKDKIEKDDVEKIKEFLLKEDLLKFVEKIEIVKKRILKEEKEILKIISVHPQRVPKLRKIKEYEDVKEIYEHDIPFAKRYLIDKDIVPMTYFDFGNNRVVSRDIPKLKMVAFDIEVYNEGYEPKPKNDAIIMASFWDENGGKVITYKDFDCENVVRVKDEKELIKRVIEELKKYDLIFTYNGDYFDFPYLKERAKLYNIKLELGREGEEIKIKGQKAYIPGRIHVDLFPIAKRVLKLTKYTLEDVVLNLFNIEKLKISHKDIGKFWKEKNSILVKYSLEDAKYTYKIGTYFLPLEVMFSRIVNQTLFEITRYSSGQMVEYLLMKRAYLDNLIVPNKPDEKEYKRRVLESYEGGYVKAEKGLFNDLVYLDFKSLYPSIIITYNISPDTLDCKCCKDVSEKILNHWFCKRRVGLIPKTLKDLVDRRKKIKEQMKVTKDEKERDLLNYEQLSLKILANSILPEENLIIIEEDGVKLEKIGKYIDNLIEKNKDKIKYSENSEILEVDDNLKSFTLNIDNKKSSINKVKAVIRHRYKGKAYKIKLKSGRTIKITQGHSLFKFENNKVVCVKGEDIKVGDYIVVPKKLKPVGKNIIINIPKKLSYVEDDDVDDLSLTIFRNKEFLVKLKSTIESIENNKLNLIFKESIEHLNKLKLIDGKIYKKINKIEIKVLDKERLSIYKEYIDKIITYGTFRGDYVTINFKRLKDYLKYIPDEEFEDYLIGAFSAKIPALFKVDKKFAKFLGYFANKGRLKKIHGKEETRYLTIVYKSNKDEVEELQKVFRDVFGGGAFIKDGICINNKIVYLILKYIFKFKNNERHIPEIIFLANESILKSFIEGFIKAKKHYSKGQNVFMAKTEKFLHQLLLMFSLVGIKARFTPVKNRGYKITINPNYKEVEDLMLDKVKEIEEFEYNGYVYDLSVNKNENFLVNNIFAHNSHYGYLAYPRARFYSKECAEIVTYLGRKYIKEVIKEAEKFGFKAIYIDTDGFYAIYKEKISKEELIKKVKEFLTYINNKLPGEMELEFEGYFKRGLFITKKKYALIDEEGNIIIKGLEYVRRNWANIAKTTQKAVLEALLKEGNIEKAKKIIQEAIKNLREHKINIDDLVIYTQLTKPINEYKTTAPHVVLAKRLIKEGKRVNVGDVIGYVVVKGGKNISERVKLPEEVKKEEIDINYYIENQILPPVLRIMESLGIKESELKKEKRQLTLDFWQ
ncbi:DNA polymerase domain-containing protein [Methanocaldococcus indicus]|uniref:DNA polymerase domain-containing protein n=1 Tax=Methanocaldococcus indicus TaxID=213231 RepID=UPI003C6D495F